MALSKHTDGNSSVLEELALLDAEPILLNGVPVKANSCYRLSGNPPKVIYNTNCPDDLKKRITIILEKHQSRPPIVDYFYAIAFEQDGVRYSGRLTPAFKKGHDTPSSWHVVLNEVFFGYLHKDGNQWEVSEQRPAALVRKVGQLIDNSNYQAEQ